MDPMPILSFVSGGVIGGFIGGATKFFWERWLPDRMTWDRELKVAQDKMLARYGGPAVRALNELQQRIYVIVFKHALTHEELRKRGELDYQVKSMAFLVAQCCARLELLREKMEVLDYASLVAKLDLVSHNLAGYQFDLPLYRLEQQEIAELMLIANSSEEPKCAGYATFLESLRKTDPEIWPRLQEWADKMLVGWPDQLVRFVLTQNALVDAMDSLDRNYRWVPKNKRNKLSDVEVINNLKRRNLIDEQEAKKLSQDLKRHRAEYEAVVASQ